MSASPRSAEQPLPPFDLHLRYAIPVAAKYLGVSQSYVYLRISRGEIQTIKDGKRTFISGKVIASQCRSAK